MKPEPVERRKDALVVLGMHRSGTSALARSLSLAGAQLPSNILAANTGNLDGHWEPQEVAELNERIFTELDSGWSDTFGPREIRRRRPPTKRYLGQAREVIRRNYGDSNFIVLKEPRVAIFIDLWREALQQEGYNTSFIISVRHPAEVAESLRVRDGFIKNKSLTLWAVYMLSSELGTRNCNRLFLKYDDLLKDPEGVLDRIELELGFQFPRRTWHSAMEIQEYLKADRRHHSADNLVRYLENFDEVQRLYSYFDAASRGEFWNADVSREAVEWLDKLELTVGPLLKQTERELRLTQVSLASAQAHLEVREAELAGQLTDLTTDNQNAHHWAGQLAHQVQEANAHAQELGKQFANLEEARVADREHFQANETALSDRLSRMVADAQNAAQRATNLEKVIAISQAQHDSDRSGLTARLSQAEEEAGRAARRSAELERLLATSQTSRAAEVAALNVRLSQVTEEAEVATLRASELELQLEMQLSEASVRVQIATQRATELEASLVASEANFAERLSERDAEALYWKSKSTMLENHLASVQAQLLAQAEEFSRRLDTAVSASNTAAQRVAAMEQDISKIKSQFDVKEADLRDTVACATISLASATQRADELESALDSHAASAAAAVATAERRSAELANVLSQAISARTRSAQFSALGLSWARNKFLASR